MVKTLKLKELGKTKREGERERERERDLDIKDGAIQIKDSADSIFGGVVGKATHIYGAFVVYRHFL